MSDRQVFTVEVPERTTALFTGGLLLDPDGQPIPLAALDAITLTLYVVATGTILNSRDHVSIKNTGGGTIGATDGSLALRLGPADNVRENADVPHEAHLALIEWTYNTGADRGTAELVFTVHRTTKAAAL